MKNLPANERDTPNLKYWVNRLTDSRLRRTVAEGVDPDPIGESLYRGDFGDLAFPMDLPHSDVSYVVHGDIYNDMLNNPKIWRLVNIRSLAETRTNLDYHTANQNRLQHSIIGAIMGERILRSLGASDHDINLVILAMIVHDSAIVPLSDWGKLACPEELDEEDNLDHYLGHSFDEMFRKYDVTKEEVVETVRGRGLIGKLVNSRGVDLDKIAYTGVDVQYTMGGPKEVTDALRQDKNLFDIYEDIKFVGDEVVLSDPEKLGRFLVVRANMFSKVYLSGENRLKGAHLKGILQGLWKRGILTKDRMLSMGDEGLWNIFSENSEIGPFTAATIWSRYKEIGRHKTRSEAEQAHGGDGVLIDPFPPFNPATKTLTLKQGKVISFIEGFPEQAREVEKLAEDSRYVGVYKLRNSDQ